VRKALLFLLLLQSFLLAADNGKDINKYTGLLMPENVQRFKAEDWRIGLGAGFAFYVGNQRSFTEITTKFGQFTEFRPSFVVEVFKRIDTHFEIGGRFINGRSEVLKSKNTLGVRNDFNDFQFNVQYSINDNIDLSASPFTFNAQAGLGLIYFSSKFFEVDPVRKIEDRVLSAVGYGDLYRNSSVVTRQIPDKQLVPIGNLGFNIGARLSPVIALYWQNNLSLSLTNKMSGNLFKRSQIPPDGYFYTGLLLSFRLGTGANRYGCPKF
jgi:hypothetical protein